MSGFIATATDSELIRDEYFKDDPWDYYAIKEGYDLAHEQYPSIEPGIPSRTAEVLEEIILFLSDILNE